VSELDTLELAKKIVDAALNRHGSDIVLLDLREVCSFTDYFVLVSGESERQLRAIAEEIDQMLASERISPRRFQGSPSSGWIILDLGDIVVHIFAPEQRDYYRLEQLWQEATTVLKIL